MLFLSGGMLLLHLPFLFWFGFLVFTPPVLFRRFRLLCIFAPSTACVRFFRHHGRATSDELMLETTQRTCGMWNTPQINMFMSGQFSDSRSSRG